ncbi:type IV toxin-antitoxin system AbiEi family antitoxin domain-containing protein [Nocardia mangyaensis]|uniref:type IV toxin-antitoxin system AbiEi family antitoxin domain-containing protein n=1 Tax=Nocardia mangyaensis TaxID=2213200 RepID=UPI0026744194|nr:hypothetical protein [Nocardia mangyaensis]MDO3650514.1 hypothetical protein [Nocardia mangyaensis]
MSSARILAELPDTFRFTDAVELIGERQFRRLVAQGQVIRLARGLYRKAGSLGEDELSAIAMRSPRATIALRSALARHDLIDDIPSSIDIAIPRGSWAPSLDTPIRWHRFDATTFDIGRNEMSIGHGHTIGIYSAQRSIIDAIRLRHLEGDDLAVESLKRWLRHGGQPSELLRLAKAFPTTQRALNKTMSILL